MNVTSLFYLDLNLFCFIWYVFHIESSASDVWLHFTWDYHNCPAGYEGTYYYHFLIAAVSAICIQSETFMQWMFCASKCDNPTCWLRNALKWKIQKYIWKTNFFVLLSLKRGSTSWEPRISKFDFWSALAQPQLKTQCRLRYWSALVQPQLKTHCRLR